MGTDTLARFTRRAMACEFQIILQGEDRRYLADAAQAVLDEIERLEGQLSVFRARSEVSYVNAEAARRPVVVEPGLFGLLSLAAEIWAETDGAFDVTAAPLIDLWREAERTGEEPSEKAIHAAAAKVGMEHVVLDESSNMVGFDTVGVRIDLGAVGKGYAVGRAADMLREFGIDAALVSAGGSSIYALGAPEGAEGWKLGIRRPCRLDSRVETVTLRDCAMSTSGGVRQRDPEVEERYEHIIDPVSSAPAAPGSVASVTVITDDAARADALSTAFYLRGRRLAERYCDSHPGVCALFVEEEYEDGDYLVTRVGFLPDSGGI